MKLRNCRLVDLVMVFELAVSNSLSAQIDVPEDTTKRDAPFFINFKRGTLVDSTYKNVAAG